MNDTFFLTDHPRLAHPSTPAVGVIAGTTMQQAAVIPDHHVAHAPVVSVHLVAAAGLGAEGSQKRTAFLEFCAGDVTGVATDEETLAAGGRVGGDDGMLDGRNGI